MQRVDGEIYTITTTPLGDKLKVKPYRGDFGIFKIGPGARDIKDISVQGSLSTETNVYWLWTNPGCDWRTEKKE